MTNPLDYITLSLSGQDLRDQVADALSENILRTYKAGHNVTFRVDEIVWNAATLRWRLSGDFEEGERK